MIDVAAVRADTPGCTRVVHLNNAGAALPPRPVVDAVVGYLGEEALRGGYEIAEAHAPELDGVRGTLAELVGARPDEVAITENATRAWDLAFYALDLRPGDRILTTTTEYASNHLAFLHRARRDGVVVEVIPDTPEGEIDVEALDRTAGGAALVAINHVPTNGGLVNPAAAVGEVARRHGVPFLLDACQSVGQLPVSVDELGCDLLAATSRKFLRGPRGVGFLYVRGSFLPRLAPPFVDLHSATWDGGDGFRWAEGARRFETWERNLAGQLGLGVAARYALDLGLGAIWDRVRSLAADLRQRLASVSGVEVHDRGRVRGAIVSFTVADRSPHEVKARLRERGINVSVASAASAPLDMRRRSLDGLVRASVHYYNTVEELGLLVDAVAEMS